MRGLATGTVGETAEPGFRVGKPLYGGSFASSGGGDLPFVLPGEVVAKSPELRILEASDARTAAACAHFGTCGGCAYQHATDAKQLALKKEIFEGLLEGIPHAEVQMESGPAYHYRNRIRLRIEGDSTGTLRAGYSVRGSNAFLAIQMCPIAAPELWQAAETMLRVANAEPAVRSWLAITSEIELFASPDGLKLQLQFLLRDAGAGRRMEEKFPVFCERLRTFVPQVTGASATLDPELSRPARRSWAGTSWGAEGLSYPAAGRTYWVPRGAFFQVNRFLVDRLVDRVTAGHSGEIAWDLYAGVGLFSRALAESFQQVVAVEGGESAAGSLQAAAKAQKNIQPVQTSTLAFLRTRILQRERPSLIVLDPPRAGVGPEAAKLLARVAAPVVVYVSCDPTTLARDLAILTEVWDGGTYEVESITLIDLFPQTFHMESVSRLRRRPSPPQK